MLISEINPYIRYANRWFLKPIDNFVCAIDYRIYYILRGSGNIIFDNKAYVLKPHSLIYLVPGVPYHFYNFKDIEFIDFNFDYTQKNSNIKEGVTPLLYSQFNNEIITEKINFTDSALLNNSFCIDDVMFVCKDMYEIIEEFMLKKCFYRESSSTILKKIILNIVRQYETIYTHSKFNSVLEYIRSHFNEPINNSDLSKLFGYHPVYLNQQIKKITGLSIKQYIINHRISHAQQMLALTSASITEIATACGYESVYHFSASFSEKCGMSPVRFRKKLVANAIEKQNEQA